MAADTRTSSTATRARVPWGRQVFTLVSRQLRQIARDRVSVSLAIVAPVAAALIGSVALGAPHEVHTTFAIVAPAADAATVTRQVAQLAGDQVNVRAVATEAEARELVRRGTVTAAVVVPGSGPGTATVIANRSEQIPEAIARDLARLAATGGSVDGVSREIASGTMPVTTVRVDRTLSGSELYGPVVAIFFLFLTCGIVARSLHSERANGTLARMRAMAVTSNAILASKGITMLLLGALELGAVLLTMSLVFGASWGSLVAVAAIAAAITLAIGAIALVVAALSRSFEQAHSLEIVIALGLAALGGNLVPLQNLPDPARIVAGVTPNGVAIRAFREVAAGGSLADVAWPVFVILVLAVALSGFAFKRAQRIVAQ